MGEYEVFTVVDNDNEVIPKPYFGHKGQKYIRQDELISNPAGNNQNGTFVRLGKKILQLRFR